MSAHVRANLWLLGLTVLICSVLYPLVLLGVGQGLFRHQAQGSLIDEKGNPVTDASKARGSRLIGQPFKGDEYFQPRQSNAGNGYDASASGASNWGASNPLLRSRVARQLGPIVKYAGNSPTKPDKLVGPDVEAWFAAQTQKDAQFVAGWAESSPVLAEQWVKDNTEAVARWLGKQEIDVKDDSGAATKAFFADFVKKHPGTWPTVEDKVIKSVTEGSDVQAYFFDLWLQANRDALQKGAMILEKVPADMVMSSGSGLDPHITLKNAHYQLRHRVAEKQAQKIVEVLPGRDPKSIEAKVKEEIEKLLQKSKLAPLNGLVGVDLINVLEVNLALDALREQLVREVR